MNPRALLRLMPLAVLAATLVAWGGKAPFGRQVAIAGIVLTALAALVLVPRRCALPPWGWVPILVVPVAVLAALQWLPWGRWHPWLEPDVAVHQAAAGAARLSLDAGATRRSLVFALGVAAFALASLGLWRGRRSLFAADLLVALGALHVLAAILLAAAWPDWPTPGGQRLSGCFVYPNHFAAFSAALVPLALARAAGGGWHWWRSLGLLLLVGGVALSASRAGMAIMALIVLPMTWWLLPRRRRWPLVAGGGLVAGAWLLFLGFDLAITRFGELESQAATLNGRWTIWQGAWAVAWDHPLGAGAGCAHLAFPRAGVAAFQPARIVHMHSDPLGWLVQYGWLGAGLTLLAAGVAGWWWRRQRRAAPTGDAPRAARLLATGAGLGLLHLLLHGLVDHILVGEALVLLAALLAVLATIAASDPAPRSQRGWRATLLVVALAAAALLPSDVGREGHRVLAAEVEAIMARDPAVARSRAEAATVDRLLAVTRPRHPDLAVIQCRTLATLSNPERAEAQRRLVRMDSILDTAWALAPGHPELWGEALRLAIARADRSRAPVAVGRLRAWAPAWHLSELLIQRALYAGMATSDPDQQHTLVRELLATPGPRPPWFAYAARRILGPAGLEAVLAERERWPPSTWRCLRDALARTGTLDIWLRCERALGDQEALPPTHAAVAAALGRPLATPTSAEVAALAASADWMAAAGLSQPPQLVRALEAAGAPWSAVIGERRWGDAQWRAAQRDRLRAHQGKDWVRHRLAAIERVEAAIQGRGVMASGDPPDAVAAALAASEAREDGAAISHHRALLARYRRLDYLAVPRAVRSWVWVEAPFPPPVLRLERWSWVVVDGRDLGWRRGLVPLAVHCREPGLHRVAVLRMGGD